MPTLVSAPTKAPAVPDTRWAVRVALVALLLVLCWNLVVYAATVRVAIGFPFELDYGEGLVWQQMLLMFEGRGYGKIDGIPAIVFHYPPLYHVVTGLFAQWFGLGPLAAGRILSIAATAIMAGFIAAIAAELTKERAETAAVCITALITGLIALSLLPVQFWSVLMRVDMMSFACTFGGFYFGLRAFTRPGAIHVAAILFVAAIYSKQTALAAPMAIFSLLLFVRPRTALAGIATGVGLALAILALLSWHTDGGFLRHILSYNINRFRAEGLQDIVSAIRYHLPYHIAALFGIFLWWRGRPDGFLTEGGWRGLRTRLCRSPADSRIVATLAFLAIAAPMLLMATKSGASINYFIEWTCLITILASLSIVDAVNFALGKRAADPRDLLLLPLLLLVVGGAFLLQGRAAGRVAAYTDMESDTAKVIALVRAAPRPVISDDMVVILRGGKNVIVEPSIYAELTGTGVWSDRPLLNKIKAHEIAFFCVDGDMTELRYSAAVMAAVRKEYPIVRVLGGHRLYLPAPLPDYAAALR